MNFKYNYLFLYMKNTFSIKTYGCASNIADSGFVKQLLLNNGFKESETPEFMLINTCTVKGPTVSKIKDYIKKQVLQKENIIILGCLPCEERTVKEFEKYSIVNSYNLDSIFDVIKQIKRTKKAVHLLNSKYFDKTKYYYTAENIAIVQPLIGCLGNCTFCKTRLAKPMYYSFPLKNILDRIDDYIKQGVKEIWISSEDNAAYGKDTKLSYINLLKAIENKFKGKAMFRFGMSNPWLIKNNLNELILFFKKTKSFYKFLHIPIQSASSDVLKRMSRPYNERQIERIFSELRKTFSYKELTIATDSIVGFPLETKKDFDKTEEFAKKHDILINNVSQFWPMSFTPAQKMKQLPTEIKKERSAILSCISRQEGKRLLKSFIGKKINVYFDDVDKNGNYLARTHNYISVILKKPKIAPKLGVWKEYTVKAVESFHLII